MTCHLRVDRWPASIRRAATEAVRLGRRIPKGRTDGPTCLVLDVRLPGKRPLPSTRTRLIHPAARMRSRLTRIGSAARSSFSIRWRRGQRHQLGVTVRRCVPARRQEGPLSALGRPPAASQNGTLRIFWRSHPASPGSSRAGGGQLTLCCKVVKSSLDPQPTKYISSPLRLS
jgi:hypothetical protein